MPPSSRTVSATQRSMSSGRVTSATTGSAVPPGFSISAATASSLASVRPASATAAPSAARASAMPRPMPCPPPVTMARLPSSVPVMAPP